MLELVTSLNRRNKILLLDGNGSMITTALTAVSLNIDGAKPKSIDCWFKVDPNDLGSPDAGLYEIGSSVSGGQMSLREVSNRLNTWRVQWFSPADHDFLREHTADWVHVLQTYDGTYSNIYFNGILVASEIRENINLIDDGVFSIPFTIGTWNLGRFGSGTHVLHSFKGIIRDVRVWDTVKSPANLLHVKNNIIDPKSPNLRTWFSLREGRGNLAYDLTGNSPPAEIFGGSWIDYQE